MRPPLALVHDYLTQRGGAERTVATWCAGWPAAPLYTSMYEPAATFPEFSRRPVEVSWLNRFGPLREHHRLALPVLAPTFSRWRIDADVVLASSSGWAHGVRTNGRLVVYCHAPARWLYQHERYLRAGSLGARAHLAQRALSPALRRWDQHAAQRADTYVVNSTLTRDLVRDIYGIDAAIVAPPVALAHVAAPFEHRGDVLVVARLLPYKNVDVALAAAARMPDVTFRVVGDGPLAQQLRNSATPNVTFVGAASDEQLFREYAGCRVHLALSHEDFGITPLEAAAAGRPTVARSYGGFLDTITPSTGLLLADDDVSAITVADALRAALATSWDETALRDQAARFSPRAHLERLGEIIGVAPLLQ